MRQPRERGERRVDVALGVVRHVVAHEGGTVGCHADDRLLELGLDQTPLGAELDDVALDLGRHPGDELGALEHRERIVEDDAALELAP